MEDLDALRGMSDAAPQPEDPEAPRDEAGEEGGGRRVEGARGARIPEGLWLICPGCREIVYRKEVDRGGRVCPRCAHHFRVGALARVQQIADEGTFQALDEQIAPEDPLGFADSRRYPERARDAARKSGRTEAVLCGAARLGGRPVQLCAFDFDYMGGSMGEVDALLENRDLLFECGWSWGVVRGSEPVRTPTTMYDRPSLAEPAPYLYFTVVAVDGIRDLFSRETRLSVVTEGVLTRMLQSDPALEDMGLVIFDEFHERSLNADLGLALCLDARETLREDLRLLVMSATLDTAPVARLLGDARVLRSEGRAYPVETRHLSRPDEAGLVAATARAVRGALECDQGDVMVFLPGAAEIFLDGFAVGHLGDVELDLYVELALESFHGGLDVNLPQAVQNDLLGFGQPVDPQRGILLQQF